MIKMYAKRHGARVVASFVALLALATTATAAVTCYTGSDCVNGTWTVGSAPLTSDGKHFAACNGASVTAQYQCKAGAEGSKVICHLDPATQVPVYNCGLGEWDANAQLWKFSGSYDVQKCQCQQTPLAVGSCNSDYSKVNCPE